MIDKSSKAAEMLFETKEIEALSQNISQLKQKPFAYLNHDNTLTIVGTALREHAPIALYTVPPSKPWVSLTSEELASIVVDHAGYPTRQLAAIEAALRSKNT